MERAVADLPTYKAGDAADLKSELIKAGGSLVKLLLKLVNWVWELETLPTAWSQGVIVNLFKAGDTAARELQGITLVSICRKMFTNMLRKRMESRAPARGSGGVQQKILHRQLVRAHAHPPRGWQGQQNCHAFFLDVQSV
jgi:hypothetical protein